MEKKTNIISIFLLSLVLFLVYHRWFTLNPIIGGDWPYYFNEMLKEFPFPPLAWSAGAGYGFGGLDPVYFLSIFHNFTITLSIFFGLPWVVVYKIFWFGLFIILSIYSSIYFLRISFPDTKYWQQFIGSAIFVSNTYILMVSGGGQMGVALAYSVVPLVLARFIRIIQNFDLKIQNSLIAGLVLAVQVLFDPRIAYIAMIGVVFYLSLNITKNMVKNLYLVLFVFIIPAVLALLLHATWILPILISRQSPFTDLGNVYTGAGIVRFLSFSTFSQALSLLHPNWPENIFGKVYFLKPEFLILPIIAFSSLLFTKNKIILFFSFIGLLGAFLAKGANPPLGGIYLWLFENIPGFVMFRDPTKFYLLTALSYSVLIPFSIYSICGWVNSKVKSQNYLPIILLIFFVGYWVFLIHPAILGKLGGTFKKHEVPKEYFLLKDFLHNQPDFFRTLWVPRSLRFDYFSNNHSVIEFEPIFGTRDNALVSQKLRSEKIREYIKTLGVKYIIVPFDPLGDVFVKDRKYDNEQYKDTIKQLETIPWLTKLDNFGRIAVFEAKNAKDHLTLSKGGEISYTMNSPVDYAVEIEIQEPQYLIFSENYNPSWIATSNNFVRVADKTSLGFNSFFLPAGKYGVKITFSQQKYYEYGQIISIAALLCIVSTIFALKKKKV